MNYPTKREQAEYLYQKAIIKNNQYWHDQEQQAIDQLNTDTMIKMQVVGRLGKDCTVNNVNGNSVINFTVAHSEKFKGKQGNPQERTTWVDCAYWTDRTAVAPYLQKGTLVFVEGTPEVRSYVNNQGETKPTQALRVREVQLLGGKSDGGQQQQEQEQTVDDISSDLPF